MNLIPLSVVDLLFQQETVVVVETCEIQLLFFLKKKLLLLKKHFETVMLMWPRKIFNFVILQYIQ